MRRMFGAIAPALALSGCVNMSAVGEFATASSVLASNGTMLDASDAQRQVRALAGDAGLDAGAIEDPGDPRFRQQQAVTAAALDVLARYMATLANLSGKGTTAMGADISAMSGSLADLKVDDPKLQSALSATAALANLLTGAAVRYTTRRLVLAAAAPVDRITLYLADQAQVVADTYRQAAILDAAAWSRLMAQTPGDATSCAGANLCRLAYRLGHRAGAEDAAHFAARAEAARRTQTALAKIRKDHAALVANVDHLTAARVMAELQADAPDIQRAIAGVRGM